MMKSSISILSYIGRLAPLAPLVAVGIAIWIQQGVDLLRWPGIEKVSLSSMIRASEDGYLLRMRDTHLGCLTLQYRQADIVFIGDSHTYAGYDYALLQDLLHPRKVGSCALAGMAPENVIHFLDATRGAGILPTQLVFGISPEMFWKDKDRRDQTARAQREIRRIGDSRENLVSLLTMRFKAIPDFKQVEQLSSRQNEFARGMAGLTEHSIQAFFQKYNGGLHALDYWSDAVAKASPDGQGTAIIEKVCAAAKRSHVRLGVVYIPESRWLVSRFSPEQRAAFLDVMAKFSCADWVDFSFFDTLGGPDSWFVNRSLIENYPYDAWKDPDRAVSWQQEAPDTRKWQFFDPDHMNPMGASIFSKHIAAEIMK
jgi:hypothetical protein